MASIQRPLSVQVESFVTQYWFPTGLFALLIGIFWFDDRRDYHHAYNLLIVLPCLLMIVLGRSPLPTVRASKVLFASIAAFIGWAALTTLWLSDPATPSRGISDMLRHASAPIWLLFAIVYASAQHSKQIQTSLSLATFVAGASTLWFLQRYWAELPQAPWDSGHFKRLIGFHGLQVNSLLTAHVMGFFAVLAAANIRQNKVFWLIYVFLVLGVIATGARTNLAALGLASLVVMLSGLTIRWRILLPIALVLTLVLTLLWDTLLVRGLSYRPEIWYQAWQEIQLTPWFGTGWGSAWHYQISAQPHAVDAHNLTLAVWRDLGGVGLILWLTMWSVATIHVWKRRSAPLSQLVLGLLVYGFCAGLTEGVAYLSRPKEHWFIIWLPMALALLATSQKQPQQPVSQ